MKPSEPEFPADETPRGDESESKACLPELLILGAVSNAEKRLQTNIECLERALGGYSIRWFLVESNSADKTLEILSQFKSKNPSFDFVSIDSHFPSSRVSAIAEARNVALERARIASPQPDYVLVIDLDQAYQWPLARFPEPTSDRDATFAHQSPYYDLFAFVPNDRSLFGRTYSYREAPRCLGRLANFLFIRPTWQLRLGRLREPITVRSAFGGAALYKYETYILGSYNLGAALTSRQEVCEHVVFHESISKFSPNLVLDPDFSLPVRNEHAVVARNVLKFKKTFSLRHTRCSIP